VEVRELRGNVDTRLAKLDAGVVDAVVLASAGLERLGLTVANAVPLPLEEMVPAPGQGALAVQVRATGGGDDGIREAIGLLDHPRSRQAFESERALVARLGGGCALPLGAYAEARAEGIRMLAVVIRPDGSDLVWAQAEAPTAEEVALEAGDILAAGGAREILAALNASAFEAGG